MKFILCADLHLKETEKEYCFSVLNEITGHCVEMKCEALLMAGDVFDSRDAVDKLRAGFRAALERLPSSCRVYFLPGNHEELRADGSASLANFNFGSRVELLDEKPYSLNTLDEKTELLAIPFQRDCSEYRSWEIPPKKKALRILLAHGTVPGIIYTGPGEDTNGIIEGIIDEDLFTHFNVDIAALGHLHENILFRRGAVLAAYPGSARVWREGEAGKRKVLFCNTESMPLRLEPVVLASAGEYRVIPVFASPEGELRLTLPPEISRADWLDLDVEGVVEDETLVIAALEKLKAEFAKNCRKLNYSTENLSVLAGVSTHPLALSFLRSWEDAAPRYAEEESGVYELARLQGLLSIKAILEKRR